MLQLGVPVACLIERRYSALTPLPTAQRTALDRGGAAPGPPATGGAPSRSQLLGDRRLAMRMGDLHAATAESLRFHRYDQLPPSPGVGELLQEIDRDPIAIF